MRSRLACALASIRNCKETHVQGRALDIKIKLDKNYVLPSAARLAIDVLLSKSGCLCNEHGKDVFRKLLGE